ncbi:hypothetical protein JZU71_00805 [bacterium]|nr:hypothetical protein [bacterium]
MRLSVEMEEAEALNEAVAAKKKRKKLLGTIMVSVLVIAAFSVFVNLGYSPIKVGEAKEAYLHQAGVRAAAWKRGRVERRVFLFSTIPKISAETPCPEPSSMGDGAESFPRVEER